MVSKIWGMLGNNCAYGPVKEEACFRVHILTRRENRPLERLRTVSAPFFESSRGEDEMKRTLVIAALMLLVTSATAQFRAEQTKDAVGAALRDILPDRQKLTIAAVEAMPADKFAYKPSADQRTFGNLVVHMTETNYLLCSKVAGVPTPKVDDVKGTDSKDKLVAALKASFNFCSEKLSTLDDSNLALTTQGFGGEQVTRAWFTLILAGTWFDHYAETAMYLRLNGVLPPPANK